jgi:hypothetical protein
MTTINLSSIPGTNTISLVPTIITQRGTNSGRPSATVSINGTQFGNSFTLNGGGVLLVSFFYSGFTNTANSVYTLTFSLAKGSLVVSFPPLLANTGSRSIDASINRTASHFTFPPIIYTVTNYTSGTYFAYVRLTGTSDFSSDGFDPWLFVIEEYPAATVI